MWVRAKHYRELVSRVERLEKQERELNYAIFGCGWTLPNGLKSDSEWLECQVAALLDYFKLRVRKTPAAITVIKQEKRKP